MARRGTYVMLHITLFELKLDVPCTCSLDAAFIGIVLFTKFYMVNLQSFYEELHAFLSASLYVSKRGAY